MERILFRNRAASGVSYFSGGVNCDVSANREVILCAGAVRTPALLERSGIGSGALLEGLGIPVIADRAQVGENLQDHFMPRVCFETSEKGTVNHMLNSRSRQVCEALKFIALRKGMFSYPSLKATAYVRSDPFLTLPNLRIQIGLMSAPGRIPAADNSRTGTPAAKAGLDPRSSFHIGVYDIYPQSRGSSHIQSPNAGEAPVVQPNYLGAEADRRTIVSGLRLVQELSRSPPLRGVIVNEIRPAYADPTDDDLRKYAATTAGTCWHPVGTCRMGGDANSVVDPDCRVREVSGLRVVDASVFPFITSSNTNVPVMMLAERMADKIRRAT